MDLGMITRNAAKAQHMRQIRKRSCSHRAAWTPEEINKVKLLFPDKKRLMEELPRRTWVAIRTRAGVLGLRKKQNRWLASELSKLRKMWIAGASREEICSALPNYTWQQIRFQAGGRKFPRPKKEMKTTGHQVIDQIKERARYLNLSMSEVDKMAHTGSYFYRAAWIGRDRPSSRAVSKAAHALDGQLSIVWN